MPAHSFWPPMIASLLACLVTTIGIYVIKTHEQWGRKAITYFICFAAGVLIAVPFLHIIPEALLMNPRAPAFLLIGFLVLHLTNRYLEGFVCGKERDISCTVGMIAALGIGFHSFIDGVVYSVTFSVSTFTGILAATGMILHEFPEGIITFLLLLQSGFNARTSALYAFLAAAISTPLGTLVSYPFVSSLEKSALGMLLALSAGALIYVGATHLLPEAERAHKRYGLLALLSGIAVAVIIIMSKAH